MDLKACYDALGGNYEQALGRLRSEKLIQKYVLRFLDEKSHDMLTAALDARNAEDAFRAAHTLKGICLNLSFDRLLASASELSELLRDGWTDEALPCAERVKADYERTVQAILAFKAKTGA